MIILALVNVIKVLLNILLAPISLPQLPADVQEVIDYIFQAIASGLSYVFYFFDRDFMVLALVLVIAVDKSVEIYCMIRWVYKKLPFGGG